MTSRPPDLDFRLGLLCAHRGIPSEVHTMYCERCGRFCLFKKICSDCALSTTVQSSEPPASPRPGLLQGLTAGTHIKMNRTLSISLNGKKASFDLSGGITDGLVEKVADQTKLTLEEARALLQAQGSPKRMIEVGNEIAQAHHLGAVKCPACAGEVPPGKFCSQCGHPLA